ncbi:hypothetical protein IU479_01170 [Nocardia abscessus]|uniref:hypothetical protein n=1 Tax=Nocardia abscessus TaxID=120957 RepID=UPI001893B4A4|nr:hypothetical protein [Nocardia abscessus]MBF6216724.1 hypothetical protein [Nocardia abscessus]
MSESNGEGHRSRRRAVRSAGPPVEENATATDAGTATDAKAVTATDAKTAAADGAKTAAADDAKTAPAEVSAGPAAGTVVADNEPRSVDAESSPPTAPAPATDDSTADAGEATVTMTKAAAESSSTEKKPGASNGRGLPRILALAAAALLVIALVCGATLSVLATRSAHERDERRAEYVETARQAIVNLTTIRADSAKQDIDRILSLASGEFKTEFDGRVDPFTSIVQQAKVVSTGEIVEAALESDDDRSGRVLVAAKQSLTNAGQAEPQTRYYRFRVTVSRGDSGLTVSDVEFVA